MADPSSTNKVCPGMKSLSRDVRNSNAPTGSSGVSSMGNCRIHDGLSGMLCGDLRFRPETAGIPLPDHLHDEAEQVFRALWLERAPT